jgi:hypothetical protein
MASTKADNNRKVTTYVDDLGNLWAVGAKVVYVDDPTDGAKYGAADPASTVQAKPKQLRMRAVKCNSAGHPSIWIPVYTTTAALWATPGTTVTRNLNGVDVVYTAGTSHRGERYRDGIRQTA